MNTFQLKTNIHCGGCVAKVTPFLNQVENIEDWRVDTAHADKILTVSGEEDLTIQEVEEAVEKAGFTSYGVVVV